MAKSKDYSRVTIPGDDTDRKDYNCNQRRADLLKIALAAGDIDAIQSTKICDRYGVSMGQISHDKKVLRRYINENYYQSDVLKSQAVMAKKRALKGAIHAQDWRTVNQISNDLLQMGFNLGILEKTPEKIETVSAMKISWGDDEDDKGTEDKLPPAAGSKKVPPKRS